MADVYGHKKSKSLEKVVTNETFDAHTHGIITRNGTVNGVSEPMLLICNAAGKVVASRVFSGDLTVEGTLTASKVVGAVYA